MQTLEFLKNAGLIVLPFSVYLAWIKIGYKVAATYSWQHSRFVASGIGSVTLMNMKDRPLAIFSIHAVMDGMSFGLKEFDPPLILKAMEAVTVETQRVSYYYAEGKVYEWTTLQRGESPVDIYLSTSLRTIKCSRRSPPSRIEFAMKRRLRLVTTGTRRFNEVIYNQNARYALIYTEEGRQRTVLISTHGDIDWHWAQNRLPPSDMRDIRTVHEAIERSGIAPLISPYAVHDLHGEEGRR